MGVVLAVGLALSLLSFREGRMSELERAESDFAHRALQRHALTREILGHYEDALFGLSSLFVSSDEVTLDEFVRATERIAGRISGVQAFQWVPRVAGAERGAFEQMLARSYGRENLELGAFDAQGARLRAADRDEHYPIAWIHPLGGNERALAYDLKTGPTLRSLERAREKRAMVLTQQFRLVQEPGDRFGVVMVLPVYRPGANGSGEEFAGFLQCVYRVHDLLDTAYSRQPETILEMIFVDATERDRARRVLYRRGADGGGAGTPALEQEFRAGLHREMPLPIGGRDWRMILRPQPGWLEQQLTLTPFLRSGGLLLVSGLVAGIIGIIGRRTATIRREVAERTAELAESRRQLENMLDALPGMAFRCSYDEQLTVLFLSNGARTLTGWTPEEFTSRAVHFRDCVHPDDLARVREATRAALQDRTDVELEYRIRTKTGAEKWVLSRGRGVYAPDGTLRFFEGLAIDITAQKQAESARLALERKLLEGQKLESLGLLAGGIAHDFNNLLSTVIGNANLVRIRLPAEHAAESAVQAIEVAAMRAAELCRQMLAYAGKGRFVIEAIDLTTLVEELVPLLKVSVAHHGTLRLEVPRGLPAVSADATQLRQIVMNLVLNAADAIAGRNGEIVVSTGTMRASGDWLASCVAGTGLPAGDYVYLEVRDNGVGMPADVRARIFDPFFTTKFAGRGLGLAAVLGIVRGHHGALQLRSEPDRGSTFRLLLPPIAAAATPAVRHERERASGWQHRGRVLVVEDEPPVRMVVGEILKSFGFQVTPVGSGADAVEVFTREGSLIDMVMLDLLMPEMGGEEVLARLRAINPDVRVLLMSGYSEGDLLGRLSSPRGKLGFVAKPFTRTGLEAKLREVLA